LSSTQIDLVIDADRSRSFLSADLGGINPAKYTGAITYTPVTQANYWTVALGGIKVNGKAISSSAPAAVRSDLLFSSSFIILPTFRLMNPPLCLNQIIDTGTTLIYGPQASVASLYGAIPGSKVRDEHQLELQID
jgi:hypothetical protein